ncbi:MAG: ATP-dependent 6-phosphofructokinase [Clostridia bacterium]|nr:ATP-dependent 6-phosphofructokinase [Clostridia bacterium]
MSQKFRRIGVLTSGGDAPGMNAAVRAVARAAIQKGVEVVAIYEGYKGLITENLKVIGNRDVSNILNVGGTALYSDRCLEFKTEEGMQKAIDTCKKYEIDGIVAIGGDGTFRGATDLSWRGIPTIGIPATIDNDITSTDYALGFDTAMNTVLGLGDKLRDTCESHARCNVIEVMGRNAGYIALQTGIALGASAIVLRECDFDEAAALEKIKASKAEGKRNFIVIVAEGVPDFAEGFAKKIQAETGIETKFCRPAHIVRGGSPTLRDRLIASQYAEKAVELLLAGKSDVVVCMRDGKIVETDISYALILDRMYKGTLKEGDLDKFTPEQVEAMKAFCAMRDAEFKEMYALSDLISH